MGDRRRFDLFAQFIARQVPDRAARIADVAAGKGSLSFALRRLGYQNVVPFEPKPRKGGHVRRLGMRVGLFNAALEAPFDVVVGMHPDDGTDHVLDAAVRSRGTLAIVVPCCVRPSAWPWPEAFGASHWAWLGHLVKESKRRGLRLGGTSLPMTGRNTVLYGRAA